MHSFKRACIATAAVLLCTALMYIGITAPYFGGASYYYQDAQVRKDLAGTVDTLVLGSSNAMRGVSPEILDRELGACSYNLGGALQTMRGRYYLLSKELERNPVKTVIMEVSAYSLTRDRAEEGPEGDLYLLGRLENLPQRVDFFFRFFTPEEYGRVLYDSMQRGFHGWSALLRGSALVNEPEAKGFHGVQSFPMWMTESQLAEIYHAEALSQELNAESVLYFEKCMELCREKGIRVVLVDLPVSSRELLGHTGFETTSGWYRDYAEKYGCEFYDFNLLVDKFEDYSERMSFLDESHLSDEGAVIFTTQLCDFMKAHDQGRDISDLFFETYQEAEIRTLSHMSAWDYIP